MPENNEMAIATLAAAIITLRGAKHIPTIRAALEDAKWLLFPKPGDAEFKKWELDASHRDQKSGAVRAPS
jgi:hypothetical protein